MLSGNSSEPRTPEWREQRRIEICRQLKGTIEKFATEEADRNLRRARGPATGPPTEEEVNGRRRLEESKQEWLQLCTELAELLGLSRAYITQRLNESSSREQGQGFLDLPQQNPRPDASNSVAGSPEGPGSTAGEAIHQEIGPGNDSGLDADNEFDTKSCGSDGIKSSDDNEAVAPDNPSTTVPQTRYISRKDLDEQGLWGVGIYNNVYRNEATDALYFLNDLSEEVWLIDENGDTVFAQDQTLGQTAESSPEADP